MQPEAAPLYVLVSKLNKRVAISTTVEWPENDLNPSWSSLAAAATSAATNFTVAGGEGYYFNVYDLVKIPSTGEIILVTAIAACAITAIRAFGSVAASTTTSAANGSTLVIIGSAFEEGSSSSALVTKSRKAARVYNYLQTIRKSVEVTNTMLNSELYGGNYRAYERKVKGIELMRDIERMALYGDRLEDTTLSSPTHARRTSGGADYFISDNVTAVGGILTESDFEAFIRTVTRFGGDEVYLFASPLIISVISQWAQGKLQMYPKDKTYGIAIAQYLSPHGTLNLIKDYMLENAGSVSNTALYGGYAFALKLDEMVYRFLQNRDVTMEADIQHPGDDFVKDQYICEIGIELHSEEKHGILTGVTG